MAISEWLTIRNGTTEGLLERGNYLSNFWLGFGIPKVIFGRGIGLGGILGLGLGQGKRPIVWDWHSQVWNFGRGKGEERALGGNSGFGGLYFPKKVLPSFRRKWKGRLTTWLKGLVDPRISIGVWPGQEFRGRALGGFRI